MNLNSFFRQHPRVALAFSGGADSAYLLYAAIAAGCDVHAYYVKSAFQPQFELDDAIKLAGKLDAAMTVLALDVLSDPMIRANPAKRCYYCKKKIFQTIQKAAREDGYELLIDGTNASDDIQERPGTKALRELSVRSPLRECGLTKDRIRSLSKDAGLFTWDKPAYACLATRIPVGTEITSAKLELTEQAEMKLSELGFTDFRIRLCQTDAKIQVPEKQLEKVLLYRKEILKQLKPFYSSVTVDLEVRS